MKNGEQTKNDWKTVRNVNQEVRKMIEEVNSRRMLQENEKLRSIREEIENLFRCDNSK